MKKEINPMMGIAVLAVLLVLLGSYFWYSQSRVVGSVRITGPDGKRHMPSVAGGGGQAKPVPAD